jgi:hypothetical protein
MACHFIKCCTLSTPSRLLGLIFLIMYTFLISTIGFCSGTHDEFYCVGVCSDEYVDLKCEIVLSVKVSLTVSMFSCSSGDRINTHALFQQCCNTTSRIRTSQYITLNKDIRDNGSIR